MPAYRLAPALAVLRAQVNEKWQRRSKASDGWIGDAKPARENQTITPTDRGSFMRLI